MTSFNKYDELARRCTLGYEKPEDVIEEARKMTAEDCVLLFLGFTKAPIQQSYTYTTLVSILDQKLRTLPENTRNSLFSDLMVIFPDALLEKHIKRPFVFAAMNNLDGFSCYIKTHLDVSERQHALHHWVGEDLVCLFGQIVGARDVCAVPFTTQISQYKKLCDELTLDFYAGARMAFKKTSWQMSGVIKFLDMEKWDRELLEDQDYIIEKIVREASPKSVKRLTDVLGPLALQKNSGELLYTAGWSCGMMEDEDRMDVVRSLANSIDILNTKTHWRGAPHETFYFLLGALDSGIITSKNQDDVFLAVRALSQDTKQAQKVWGKTLSEFRKSPKEASTWRLLTWWDTMSTKHLIQDAIGPDRGVVRAPKVM